jgi:hypothetical protein
MPNLSKTFKTGETVTIPGRYECLTCKYGGSKTEVQLEQGVIFPMCQVDSIKDATWRLVGRDGVSGR